MPARQIGELEFDAMQGGPCLAAEGVEPIAPVPGEYYQRYRLVGKRVKTVQIVTQTIITGVDLVADLATAREDQLLLQGTAVTVYDAHGGEHPNCMIVSVEPGVGVAGFCPAGPCIRLETRWTVERGAET